MRIAIILLFILLYPSFSFASCLLDEDCDDSVACTIDVCVNPGPSGYCTNVPSDALCDDGLFCTGEETCDVVSGCEDNVNPCLDDSTWCNGSESCNEATNSCEHSGRDCDDGVDCTTDVCLEDEDLCGNFEDDSYCDDGLWCNGYERCDDSTGCEDSVDPCVEDGLFCNGTTTCNEVTNRCGVTSPGCDDGVNCTLDACSESTDTCTHTTRDNYCNDYLYCTGTEACTLAGCVASGDPCDDDNECTTDTCNEATDSCTNVCDDILLPSDDCCDDETCMVDAQCTSCTQDSDCDDGLWCNGSETCNLVTSLCDDGTSPDCDDSNACTNDLCYEAADSCVNICNAATPSDTCCEDEACGGTP